MWLGKIFCGFFGLLMGGPVGATIGILIGHFFDRGVKAQFQQFPFFGLNKQVTPAQKAFFSATFSIMGHIAKADGRVSEAEIQVAKGVMDKLNLNAEQRQQAINLFNQGKQPDFNLQSMLADLKQYCGNQRILLNLFLQLQLMAAQADGNLGPQEKRILENICQTLGLQHQDFENIFRQQRYSYQTSHQTQPSINDAYKVLDVDPSINNADLTKAYRRLINKHHPDKLIAKGLPEEMIKLANEKTQQIKAAYNQIKTARGMA